MEINDHNLLGDEEILARHRKLAEVIEGKRSLDWSDLETFIYDSCCLTPQGKQVGLWAISQMKECLKDQFLSKARHTPEILTVHPFFALDFFPGVNDVSRVYADVFRFALELFLLQNLERFRGMVNETVNNLEAVRWHHTLLQLELASLGQKEKWQIQLELPYNNGTRNRSDVVLGKDGIYIEVDATSIRPSEKKRKKWNYDNWLTHLSIQFGVNTVGRIGEPWSGGKDEELQWVKNTSQAFYSVSRNGLIVIVHSPNGGSLALSRAPYGKTGMATIHDGDVQENIWGRILVALERKNRQASGHNVWLRMGEYAGLWHESQYRDLTLGEKMENLSSLLHTELERFPHIAGVILSPRIFPVSYPDLQTPCNVSSGDGSVALRCSLPGHCTRETIIIPRQNMEADALALAALYEHEDTWLDWALLQAGHPPFHQLVQEQ